MNDNLFDPANEWHDYRGCRLLRSRAAFTVKQGFVFVNNTCVEEINLIDTESEQDHPPHSSSPNPATESMVAGYIILSKRTTLSVFRSILPDTARFFFLSPSLLRRLRKHRRPAPQWCRAVLLDTHALIIAAAHDADELARSASAAPAACRRPVASEGVNKPPPDCAQHMSGYYTGLACLVLFDARGPPAELSCGGGGSEYLYIYLTLGVSALLLSLKYLPTILHRPQQLVDALCNDVLCVAAHAAFIAVVVDPCLRHGCALHSACFILQQRFMGKMPLATVLGRGGGEPLVHTTLILTLLAAYAYGPRISDVRQFMLSAVCPHALELLAQLLARVHRLAVLSWCADA